MKASTISNWAQNVRPGKPPHLPERQPSETPDIRSSSSETESLIMTEGTGKTLKTLRQSLENRQIHLEESNERDERLKELQNNLKAELNPRPDRSQVQFLQILKSEIFETLNEFDKQSYSVLDTLLMQLDQNKNEIRYPFTHPTYFESQLEKCASRSEHVLQRTIMMNIFHPYWLPKIFEWNVEGLWQFDPYASLFGASDSEKLARPKPDLSFGFARGAFISITKFNVTVPEDLRVAISPDDSRQQYFPFLFVEVKKGGLGLEEAKLKNLRTAARALYNIHRWFEQAKHHKGTQNEEIEWDKSFQKIRIFTFAFNASELVVRIHRAETLAPGKSGRSAKLIFSFADFFTLSRGYTRDEICGLFNNIMSDYAATELLPSLQAVYRAVLDVAVQTLIDTPEQQMRRSDSDDAGVDRQVDEGSNDGDDDEEQHGYMASQQQGHFSQEPQEPQLTQNLQTSQAMQDSQPRRKRPGNSEFALQVSNKNNNGNTGSKGRGASKRKKG
ncbi:MAG: hypothetical protein M1822_003980 [Bathelium mastoideum]|nr:MAG: hypothetical protein M1822_003980 [Bathelium mastoideum]